MRLLETFSKNFLNCDFYAVSEKKQNAFKSNVLKSLVTAPGLTKVIS